jgi:DNA-3-methyladenine glycosylase I
MVRYHDKDWGTPVHEDRVHFEFLVLGGAQAGLSWRTILNRREGYRRAFDDFDPKKVARYDERKLKKLLADPGIIRNRQKISSAIHNAKMFLKVQREFGSFDKFIWSFVQGRPKVNRWTSVKQIPARSPESDALSRELIRRGFRFAGTTICYAVMQTVGLVNDHTVDCFRHSRLAREGRRSLK